MDHVLNRVRNFSLARSQALVWIAVVPLGLSSQQPLAVVAPNASPPAVERYTFRIALPDTGKHIGVRAVAQLFAPVVADTVVFDLDDAMQVRAVSRACDGDGPSVPFTRAAGTVRVPMPRPRTDGAACVAITYDGAPADGLIISTDSAGRWAAFGDNFAARARFWLATLDHPSRKAKVTFIVTAPAGRTVVANGSLASVVTAPGGRVTTTWREDRAIPTYGMVIAAAALSVHDLGKTACGMAEDGGCVPQMVWTAPEQARYMPGHFARAGDIVSFYARTVGAYPYEKLGHVQSMTRYGGMENPAAIFYFDRGFRRAGGIDDGLIAHETAHQWFGDAVTEREWAHVWLSEGFATFFAALWAQHARGDTAYVADLARNRAQVLRAAIVTTHAVIDSVEPNPDRLLNENSYQKGGLVLAMLRDELGDSAFFGGLRRYYAAHRHANAMTQDLQRAFEDVSGRPLGWFFDQWLRRPGWAELRMSYTWDRATERVTLSVEQGERFGAYQLALPVDVVAANGAPRRVIVALGAQARQRVVLPGRFVDAPRTVSCDPDQTHLVVCTAP